MIVEAHHALVIAHICTGSVGLLAFWAPVAGKKGDALHRRAGGVFIASMLLTGSIAVLIALTTLMAPVATHPHVELEAAAIEGIFGWMMIYLATLTVNLAWYGWSCVRNRGDHGAHRRPLNYALQGVLAAAALNCFLRGLALGQPLMMGVSFVGFATVGTNLFFMLKRRPGAVEWLKEHLKGLVGAGISVYTAFFAFGAVRLLPEAALNPALWAAPLLTGLSIILYHWRKLSRPKRGRPTGAAVQAG